MITNAEEELLAKIRASDYAAFEQLHQQFYPMLYALAIRKLSDADEAYDLLQELFIEIWEKRASFYISNPLPNYLKNRLWFKLSGHFRKKGFQEKHLSAFSAFLESDPLPAADPMEVLEIDQQYQELMDRISQVVEAMPEKMREVFQLSLQGNLSITAIASQLQISPKTVSRQINNAMERIRRQLADTPLSSLQLLILVWLTKN